jgi:tetratricopeptide (TPR) repeat protein
MKRIKYIGWLAAVLWCTSPAVAQVDFEKLQLKGELNTEDTAFLLDITRQLFKPAANVAFSVNSQEVLPVAPTHKPDKPISRLDVTKLEKKLADDPDNPALYNQIGNAFKRLNEREMAMNYFTKAERMLRDMIAANEDSSALHTELGLVYMNMEYINQAANKFMDAYEMDPNDTIAKFSLPLMLYYSGRYEKARQYAMSSIFDNPEDPTNYMWVTLFNMGERMIEFSGVEDPKQLETQVRKLVVDSIFDLTAIRSSIDSFPDEFSLQVVHKVSRHLALLCKSYYTIDKVKMKFNLSPTDLKELKSLEKFYKVALSREDFTNRYVFYKALGAAQIMRNDYKKAIPYLEKAIAMKPIEKSTLQNNPTETYDNLIGAYILLDDMKKTEEAILRKIKDQPEIDPKANNYAMMADLKIYNKAYAEAEGYCLDALKLDKQCEKAHLAKGGVNMMAKNWKEAEKDLNKAFKLNQANINTFFLMGVISILKGDETSAKALFKIVLEQVPNEEHVNDIAERCFKEKEEKTGDE